MAAKFFSLVTITSPKPPLDSDESCLTWEQRDQGAGVTRIEECTPNEAIARLEALAASIKKATRKASNQPVKNRRRRGLYN
jgi:hypothetical protein